METAILTALCGLITLLMFKGSGVSNNYPANHGIKSVIKESYSSIKPEPIQLNSQRRKPHTKVVAANVVADQSKVVRKLRGGETQVIGEEIRTETGVIKEEIRKEAGVIKGEIRKEAGEIKVEIRKEAGVIKEGEVIREVIKDAGEGEVRNEEAFLLTNGKVAPSLENTNRNEEAFNASSVPSKFSLGPKVLDWDEQRKLLGTKFSLGPKVLDWDEQRKFGRTQDKRRDGRTSDGHHEASKVTSPPILMVTGSVPFACENPSGDHVLLKSIKNKMDYCTLHTGITMFYNLAHMSDEMTGFWSKLPLLRELMLARPDVEWLWWIDSDAVITNMEFNLPMERYKDYNLIVPGWEENVYVKKSWLGLNAGIFFLRNCQWSLDFLDEWAQMGPKGPIRNEAGKELSKVLSDRPEFEADDQSALVYLLIKQREVWGNKVYMESSYCLHGYWVPIVEIFDEMMDDMLETKKNLYNETTGTILNPHGHYFEHANIDLNNNFVVVLIYLTRFILKYNFNNE